MMESQSPQEVIQSMEDNCQLDCLLNLIELLLPALSEVTIIQLILWMEMSCAKMTQLSNLPGKRLLKTFLAHLLQLKKQMKEEKIDPTSTISFMKFTQLLRAKEYFTMWCQTSLPEEVANCLKDVFVKNLKEDCSDVSSILIMSMSSTTVPGAEGTADVQECKISPINENIEKLFGTTILDFP